MMLSISCSVMFVVVVFLVTCWLSLGMLLGICLVTLLSLCGRACCVNV